MSFSPCLDGRARSPVPRRLSRERFRPRLGPITHRQASQTGGRQATQQVLAVTLEAPSEAQQSRIRAAGMDRCTSKLHTADCLVRSLPACPRRRRPVIGARVHRRWRRASSYCTLDGAAPAGPPNTRPTDSSSHVELVLAAPGAGCVGLAPLRGFPCKTWPEANTILHTDDASPKTTPLLKRASISS